MATKAIYDMVVKTGTYMKNSEEKPRWLSIGKILQKDDGGKFILLNKTFNPAGVPDSENRDNILVSMFPTENQQQQKQQQQSAPTPQDAHNKAKSNGYQDDGFGDDDIPF